MKATFVLLLSLATAYGATHVNISIAQQPATNPADVAYVDGNAPAELRAGPTERLGNLKYSDESYEGRSAQLRVASDNSSNFNHDMRNMKHEESNMGFGYDGRSVRVEMAHENKNQMQGGGGNVQSMLKSGNQYRGHRGYGRMSQRQRQLRPQNSQEKQNQEFERYIQNYHSGPTVETVYETSSPAPQRYQESKSSFSSPSSSSSSSVKASSRPARIQTFERQVALPAEAVKEQPAEAERQTHIIVNSQPKPITEVTKESEETKVPVVVSPAPTYASPAQTYSNPAPTYSNPAPTYANSAPTYETKKTNSNTNFDQTYLNRPDSYDNVNYDQHNFGYDQDHNTDLHNQYLPPSVDEPQGGGGYNDYYGQEDDQSGYYGSSRNDYYPPQQPTYHRPVVTKTIQIAQPALKTKKFEIRHPAIQKEFYDIEERVLIRPAGTVVLELDHPVAKIPRDETILPLGHPHPAVASAYDRNDGSVIQHQISSSGSYDDGGRDEHDDFDYNNKQYSPSPVYNTKPQQRDNSMTTLGSSITATPTNNQQTKDATVEANLNRQFIGEAQLSPSSDGSFGNDKQLQNVDQDRYYVATVPNGNQVKVQSKHLSPKMIKPDESDVQYPAYVEVKSNGAPVTSTSTFNQQSNEGKQFFYPASEQQGTAYSLDQGNGNFNKQPSSSGQLNSSDGKEDQFQGEYLSGNFYSRPQDMKPARLRELPAQEPTGTHTHVIKHEHKIHLPPVQHNIYLGSLEKSSVPSQNERKNANFEGTPAHVSEFRPYLQRHNGPVMVYASTKSRPNGRYSDAVAQRFVEPERRRMQIAHQRGQLRNSNEGFSDVQYSAPYSQMRYHPEESSARLTSNADNLNEFNQNKENLRLEEKNLGDAQKTHIAIQIPHLPQEAGKPIFISSTISPPVYKDHSGKYRASFQPTREQLDLAQSQYEQQKSANLEVAKPDCDQPMKHSARYESAPVDMKLYQQQQSFNPRSDQQFSRIVEVPTNNNEIKEKSAPAPVTQVQANNVDVNLKSTAGHVATPGSRVIAATPAPKDASAGSESFHKRRIVVNHPFQTVREVVEHEPVTNYHQVQVNEPASPALYRLPYTQSHGALRQDQTIGVPVMYHRSATTHGNLQYAVPSYNHHHY